MTRPYLTPALKARNPRRGATRGVVYGTTRPGYKPLAPSHRRAATSVHRPDSAGLESDCHRGRRLMFAFGEGGSKKALAGIVFGLGMAMGAANFLAWLF